MKYRVRKNVMGEWDIINDKGTVIRTGFDTEKEAYEGLGLLVAYEPPSDIIPEEVKDDISAGEALDSLNSILSYCLATGYGFRCKLLTTYPKDKAYVTGNSSSVNIAAYVPENRILLAKVTSLRVEDFEKSCSFQWFSGPRRMIEAEEALLCWLIEYDETGDEELQHDDPVVAELLIRLDRTYALEVLILNK